jgi:hypothetical protein
MLPPIIPMPSQSPTFKNQLNESKVIENDDKSQETISPAKQLFLIEQKIAKGGHIFLSDLGPATFVLNYYNEICELLKKYGSTVSLYKPQ